MKHGMGAFPCIGKSVARNKTACRVWVGKLIYPIHTYDLLPKIWREGFLEEIFLLGSLLKVPIKQQAASGSGSCFREE